MTSQPRNGENDTNVRPESDQQASRKAGVVSLLRWLLPVLALLLVAFAGYHQLHHIDPAAVHHAFQAISLPATILLLLAGLAATTLNVLYDALLLRWLELEVGLPFVMRYSWLASVLNNVVGFSGMTGSGIRYLALTNAGVTAGKALASAGLVVLSMPVGLSVLGSIVLLFHRDMLHLTSVPPAVGQLVLIGVSLYWPIYLIAAGRGPLHKRFLADTPVLKFSHRSILLAVSSLDWLAAGLLLWLCLRAAGIEITPGHALLSFTLAMTLGLISMLPGGLGVFEGAMLLLLSGPGVDTSTLLAGLLLFRVVYFFVPFVFAAQLLPGLKLLPEGGALEEFVSRVQTHPFLRIGRIPVHFLGQISTRVLAYSTFAAGVALLLSAAFPGVAERLEVLDQYVPLLAREGFHLSSVVVATLLLGLSRGIGAGMRSAYQTTQLLLITGTVLSLLKGIDVEEAAFMMTLSGLLWANRGSFSRRGYPLTSSRNLLWLSAMVSVLLAAALLGTLLYDSQALFAGIDRLEHGHHAASYARALLVMLLTFLAWLAWTWYSMPAPLVNSPDRAALHGAAAFYRDIGCTPYSFLSLMGDKQLLYDDERHSLIQYGTKRNHLIALGDPACSEDDLPHAIHQFRLYAADYNLVPVFYQVDERNLHHYHEAGFHLLKLGETARVPLTDFTLKGKKSEKLRSALNRAKRDELEFDILQQPLDEATWQRLREISDAWLADKGMAEMGFSLGFFNREYLSWGPVAVVRQHDRIVAFASITHDFGHQQEMGIDLMRYVDEVQHGVMDFLFVNLLLYAQAEGYAWFDLAMAPLSGVGESPWSPRDERILKLAYEFGNRFYNYKGLRKYKEKFRPEWRGMYLAYPRGRALPPILLDVTALITGGYLRALRR